VIDNGDRKKALVFLRNRYRSSGRLNLAKPIVILTMDPVLLMPSALSLGLLNLINLILAECLLTVLEEFTITLEFLLLIIVTFVAFIACRMRINRLQ
jgi:hypothetical protein